MLVPVFIGLSDGRANYNFELSEFSLIFQIRDVLSAFFMNGFDFQDLGDGGLPTLFCGTLINILVMLFFTNNKITLKEKIMTVLVFWVFAISFYVYEFNILWTLGNKPACFQSRYAFCYIFMCIIVARKYFENVDDKNSSLKIFVIWLIYEIAAFFVLKFNLGTISKWAVIIDMCIASVFCICLFVRTINFSSTNLKIKKSSLKIVSCVVLFFVILEMTINTTHNMKETKRSTVLSAKRYSDMIDVVADIDNSLKDIDSSIYRIQSKYRINANDALGFNFNNINFSGSTYSKSLYELLINLGYSQEHVTIGSDIGGTKASNMLLGVKYIIDDGKANWLKGYNKKGKTGKGFEIYENPYALSLGFTVSEEILEEINNDNIAFDNQNALLKKMTKIDENVYTKHKGELINYQEDDDNKKIVYEFKVEKSENIYFYALRK